ncbi:MAG: ribose 5-phosphate isomerase B [Saprospiraceae bacterium]|nr:ribose 5-phosphate isomerase B [Saprospiraceae bacterium]
MTIAIGGDHAGFLYKSDLNKMLQKSGYAVLDFGAFTDSSVDYPDFAHPVAEAVLSGKAEFGILICGSGNGVCMTANKHQGIRAALCWNKSIVTLARLHNNANILCLPARFISLHMAKSLVKLFLHTDFEGGRHQKRVNKI